MGELDFVVKKGLEVKNGDVKLTDGNLDLNNGYADIDNIKIDGNTIISTDTNGHINLTPNGNGEVNISKVDIDSGAIDDTTIGGTTAAAGTFTTLTANDLLDVNAGATITGDTTDEITLDIQGVASQSVDALRIRDSDGNVDFNVSNAGVTTAASLVATTADINAGTIDATAIGATTPSSAKVTTLTSSQKAIINDTPDGGSVSSTAQLTVIGDEKSAGTNGSTLTFAEALLYADISTDDIAGSWNGSLGLSNALVLENAEDVDNSGQGVIFTVGTGSSTGTVWGLGRQSGTGSFTIGYSGADNWENERGTAQDPMKAAQSFFGIDTSGNASLVGNGATLSFHGQTSASASRYIKFRAHPSGMTATGDQTYTLPLVDGSNTNVLQTNGSGQLSWAASASGADGMGSGFVLEDGDGTEVTIDEDKEVKFIDGDGIDINWTDTSPGSDGDPYDLTFSSDIDGMTDIGGAVATGDLLIIDDGANGTNRKTTVDRVATLFAGTGLTATNGAIAVDAAQTGITSVGTLGSLTVSGAIDLNATTLDIDASDDIDIDTTDTTGGIAIGTANSGVPITIGHGTSETTFGDNVTITGNLTVNGAQTIIDSTTVVSEDKTFILGLTGGMADATYARSGTTVTVTSTSHGFSSNEYVLVQDAGNSITDDVYQVTVSNTNTFTFTSPASGTVSAGATMLHSTNDTTEAIADGAGIYAPGTSLHSLQYDSSHGWQVTDDLDIADTKHISFNGTTMLTSTTWSGTTANSMTSASELATVGNLASGTIATGFGAIDNGTSNITTGGLFSIDIDSASTIDTSGGGIGAAGSITLGAGADAGLYVSGDNLYIENKTTDKDIIFRISDNGTFTTVATVDGDVGLFNIAAGKLGLAGTAVSSTAAELNLVDGSSAGSIVNSKAVVYSGAGQVNGTTLGVNSKAVIQTNSATSSSSSSGAAIDIFSFAHATYRTAKILLSIDRTTSGGSAALAYETAEILVSHDGTNVNYTTYAYISSEGTQLATITAAISGSNVVVKYDPVGSNTDVFNFEAVATLIVV